MCKCFHSAETVTEQLHVIRPAHVGLWCAHAAWKGIQGQKANKETCVAKRHVCLEATLLQGLPEGGRDQEIQGVPDFLEQRMRNAVCQTSGSMGPCVPTT